MKTAIAILTALLLVGCGSFGHIFEVKKPADRGCELACS